MDKYLTGTTIKALREKSSMTQAQLAELLCVSDKAVSKWETGAGYPDITLLEPLAEALRVSVAELLSGLAIENKNVSANMMKACFYVCPLCGNSIHAMGKLQVSCHGIALPPLSAEMADAKHELQVISECDELFVRVNHPMSKQHHIMFLAALSPNCIQMVRLYPEGAAEAYFNRSNVCSLYWYCNRDGLFSAVLNDVLSIQHN